MNLILLPADALVIVVAPSGAGKSTLVRRHFRPTEIVSSDHCRALVSDDEANQRATGPAFEVFHAILRGRLGMGRLSVADATNLDPQPRRRLLAMGREHGRSVVAIVLDVSPQRAQAQNRARGRSVPPHVLEMHFGRFRLARAALPDEGYDAIHEIQPGTAVRIRRIPPSPAAPAGRPQA